MTISGISNAIKPDRWRHIGKIADDAVHSIGLQAIRFHLNRAARSGGREALASFREADAIRRQLGLPWKRAFADGTASGFSPKEVA